MLGDTQPMNPWEAPPNGGDPGPTPHGGQIEAQRQAIAEWYQKYFGRAGSQQEIDQWAHGPTPFDQVEAALRDSPEGKNYAAAQTAHQPNPATPAPQGGGPAPNAGGLIQPWGKDFAPPPTTPYPNAPTFTAPTMEQAANDPGYKFGLDQGKRNLDSWMSAHGTFNDSSAAEALQDYGRNAATTQYGNVWNRQYQAYQGALQPWQTDTARIQHDNDTGWQNAFNTWLQNWNVWKDQRDSTFNKQFQTATA
jgi:hypothetical protein